MSTTTITVRPTTSILEKLAERFDRVRRRAFDLFEEKGAEGQELDHWLAAEREEGLEPPVRVSETDHGYEVEASLPGMSGRDVMVEATNEDVLITAEHTEHHRGKKHGGSESSMRIFRAIHFPRAIDREHVQAEYRGGTLRVKAAWMKAGDAPEAAAHA